MPFRKLAHYDSNIYIKANCRLMKNISLGRGREESTIGGMSQARKEGKRKVRSYIGKNGSQVVSSMYCDPICQLIFIWDMKAPTKTLYTRTFEEFLKRQHPSTYNKTYRLNRTVTSWKQTNEYKFNPFVPIKQWNKASGSWITLRLCP